MFRSDHRRRQGTNSIAPALSLPCGRRSEYGDRSSEGGVLSPGMGRRAGGINSVLATLASTVIDLCNANKGIRLVG